MPTNTHDAYRIISMRLDFLSHRVLLFFSIPSLMLFLSPNIFSGLANKLGEICFDIKVEYLYRRRQTDGQTTTTTTEQEAPCIGCTHSRQL